MNTMGKNNDVRIFQKGNRLINELTVVFASTVPSAVVYLHGLHAPHTDPDGNYRTIDHTFAFHHLEKIK